MGFWDTVGSVAKGVTQAVNEKNEKLQSLKSQYEHKSSSELRNIINDDGVFGSSSDEKMAARWVLRQRGEL